MGAEAPGGTRDIGHMALPHSTGPATLRGMKLGAAFWLNDTDWPSLREVISAALAELVESGWLDESQAVAAARAFLFDNPNQFFGLGLAE